VRVVSGPGQDVVDDTKGGGTEVWTGEGQVRVQRGPGTHERSQQWVNPSPVDGAPWKEPRNTGSWKDFGPMAFWAPDLGFVVGGDATYKSWDFRKHPFSTQHLFQAVYASEKKNGPGRLSGHVHEPRLGLLEDASRLRVGHRPAELLRLRQRHPNADEELHEIDQKNVAVEPTLHYRPRPKVTLHGGADLRYSSSQESALSILGTTQPYGTGRFGSVGLRMGLEFDSRGRAPAYNIWDVGTATSPREITGQNPNGFRFVADGVYRPAVWDVRSNYGQLGGVLSGYAGSRRVVLAARVGGQRVFGEYPWFDAAFLGGANDRGFRFQRFAGDSSLYGGAELRVWATRVRVVPLRLGLFAFYDTGRVWLDGESQGGWHDSYGGGLLMQLLSTPILVRARIAHSEETNLFYFGSGFAF
jgi:hypothetical protein